MPLMCILNRYLPAKLTPIPISEDASQRSRLIDFNSKHRFRLCCSSKEDQQPILEDFSALDSEPPWKGGSIWSSMALYFFSLHVPMSFGGLSVVAHMLNQPSLEPQTKAVAILVIETLEMFGALLLLQFTARPQYKPFGFKFNKTRGDQNWVFTALLGFVILVAVIFLTSCLADRLFDTEGANNQVLKEILLSGNISQTACTFVYCIVAPLLEEIIYRGFLLTSLAPTMKWPLAVIVSSVIFSASHLSAENFIQLFIIGVVLGCSYCWSGDLRSSILLHSLYNALTLFMAYFA